MATFATAEDLGAYLGETLTGSRLLQSIVALEIATATIQGWTRRRLEFVEDDTVLLAGTRSAELVLPEAPVVNVTAVELDGVAVAASSYQRTGAVLHRSGGWGSPGGAVEVTYSHGYQPIPDDVRVVCLQMAARGLSNPLGIRQEGIGSYNVTYAGDAPGAAEEPLLASLSRYRMRAASPSLAREPVLAPLEVFE